MVKNVAVEEGLTGLSQFLQDAGYKVVDVATADNVVAVVLTGMDNNLMGMHDIQVNAPVIDASGQTNQQILNRIKQLSLKAGSLSLIDA